MDLTTQDDILAKRDLLDVQLKEALDNLNIVDETLDAEKRKKAEMDIERIHLQNRIEDLRRTKRMAERNCEKIRGDMKRLERAYWANKNR